MKALVFTPSSLFRFSQFSISEQWFSDYLLPTGASGLKRVVIDDIAYLIDEGLDDDSGPIVVVNLEGDDTVFSVDRENVPIFERIITVARATFTESVKIPAAWRQYHEHSLLSIAASPKIRNRNSRLHFDMRPNGVDALFAFTVTGDTVDFSSLPRPKKLFETALSGLTDAVLTRQEAKVQEDKGAAGILLAERLPQGFVQGATLDQWYSSKLTTAQRLFVDKPHDGPVRLRGSAGTGKTLSLVVKFLRDGRQAEKNQSVTKLGFITHSLASVDLVGSMTESLDTIGLLAGVGKYCKLELRTLYDLAYENLRFALDDLEPLSLDGREGKRLQFELIESVLKEMYRSPIARAQYSDITSPLKTRWEAATQGNDRPFISEVMNEFASVLDAESIRSGEERGEKYAKNSAQRAGWLMHLPREEDRRFLLEIHRRYRSLLADMNTLSVDQMVADFNTFLDSNRWASVRGRNGYDALFVDELHLFTAVERQILHKLIRRTTDDSGVPKRPAIFMAYDLKQSPNDAATQSSDGSNQIFTVTSGLQNSDLVQLDKVFRYTPQIAEFLSDLDASFPALNIPDEWDLYSGMPQLDNGHKPELTVFKDERSLFKSILDSAVTIARSAKGGGRRVAVLCASEEMFDRYLPIANGQYEGKIFPISGRDPSSELRHAGKRFIFSMPEYVAGLQFDTVFLIHVDVADAPTNASLGMRRRFISNIYLGSSRAENVLKISAYDNRGGYSDILQMAIDRGSLTLIQK